MKWTRIIDCSAESNKGDAVALTLSASWIAGIIMTLIGPYWPGGFFVAAGLFFTIHGKKLFK